MSGFRGSQRRAQRIQLNELDFANAAHRVEVEMQTTNTEPFVGALLITLLATVCW